MGFKRHLFGPQRECICTTTGSAAALSWFEFARAKLVPEQDAQAPSDDGAAGATEDGSADSAFVVLKKRSEKSFKRFTLIFAVSHLILAVRTSSTPCATRPFPADR